MNNQEIANEIARDIHKVLIKGVELTYSLRRKAIKSRNKYARGVFKFISKNHNRWLILSEYFKKEPIFIAIAYYVDQHGFNALMTDSSQDKVSHFSSHFLDRYNERFLKEPTLSKIEILKKFMEKNSYGAIQNIPDKDELKNRIFVKYKDGIGLGYYEEVFGSIHRINHIKTFISDDMIFSSQQGDFNEMSKLHQKYTNEIFSYMKKRA